MAKYKVWLTVKDRYGSIKELPGGTINVGLGELSEDEFKSLDARFATDEELYTATQTDDSLRYNGFFN